MSKILMPHEAVDYKGNEDFCVALYWRYFPIIRKARNYKLNGKCGTLCSMRFSASRPAKNALPEKEFLYSHLLSILDAAQFVAESSYVSLTISRLDGKNNLFALAMFENGVSVEIELNEMLPDSMPDIAFFWANFDGGCVTNQPLIGYFNYEGLLLFISVAIASRLCDLEISVSARLNISLTKGLYKFCGGSGSPDSSFSASATIARAANLAFAFIPSASGATGKISRAR